MKLIYGMADLLTGKKMNKYPVYIVSKGRWENPLTAKFMEKDGVNYKIAVEPQESDNYAKVLGKHRLLILPFSNLGLGSYPARNECWEDSIKRGAERHWLFDDNIWNIRRLYKGKRIPVKTEIALKTLEDFTDRYLNIGISGFNYEMFVTNSTSKPFYLNCHIYSGLLIKNDLPFRWRLKYNEDVDLCLNVLHNGLCTILFNALMIKKVSTVIKMKGGNQSELYKGNAYEKKVLKARSLEEVWPQYAETIMRFNRPHHYVDWKKHFKQPLIRDPNFDWDSLSKVNEYGMVLKEIKPVKSEALKNIQNQFNNRSENHD